MLGDCAADRDRMLGNKLLTRNHSLKIVTQVGKWACPPLLGGGANLNETRNSGGKPTFPTSYFDSVRVAIHFDRSANRVELNPGR
jgi:hypothetical protein